jgi:XTP/dITP diphosphohydrolase
MIPLVVATRNQGKLLEFRQLLQGTEFRVLSLDDFDVFPEIVEDGLTFEENAVKKARAACSVTGLLALADDSGLEVDALSKRPGVHSARYAGERATDHENNMKLLDELAGVEVGRRTAAFRCVLALCSPGDECRTFSGQVQGIILEEARGNEGFGYDPLFLVPEEGKTLAEIPLAVKNVMSHRGRAMALLREYLVSVPGGR